VMDGRSSVMVVSLLNKARLNYFYNSMQIEISL
jgi:hypothetical protein